MIERATSINEALRKIGVDADANKTDRWLRLKCPYCPEGKQKRLNFALRISSDGIAYHCHRCGESGKVWIDDGAQNHVPAHKLAGKKKGSRSSVCDWRPQWDGPWRR